jgi:hypothetical protein
MQIFGIFKNSSFQRSNINSAVNIACKFKFYISKSKLVLSECNDLYFIAIAFIVFTLHEIKQCPVFLGHPVHMQEFLYLSYTENFYF